ncbi:lactonase family protein [Streptomyces sp. MAR4 CNX-425]|uniref:lactonase family protein n=1 Tax=Streptomyces sp. MAR4 CNX-425 TaxID=3406343 RepID=UPI003B50CA58
MGESVTRACVGSFSSGGGAGITVADVEPGTGALIPRHSTDAVPDPSFLAVADGGDLLYAVSETEGGQVAAFRLVDDKPEPAGAPVPVSGDHPTHLALAGGHVITANYASGSFSTVPVNRDGTLAGPAALLQHEGGGPVAERQEGPHAHQVVPDPGGRWILGVDLGTDSVLVCALDTDRGALRLNHEVRLRPGTGPRHLAFHPDGHRVYVACELEPVLTVCSWDAAAGTLEPLAEAPLLTAEPDETPYASGIAVSPDGRFCWTAVRGPDVVATHALDGDGGVRELVSHVPSGGTWPRDIALDPAGRHLYAANERSGDVTWFEIDAESGTPRRTGSTAVPGASCVVFA